MNKAIQITIEHKNHYLLIICEPGTFTFQDMIPVIDQLKKTTQSLQCNKLLIDFRALQTPEIWEQYQSAA